MAAAPLVITNSENNRPSIDGIFSGLSFFLTQRLPSRTKFVSDIQANGGRVVMLEKQADYLICDHLRNDIPAGGYSFKLIEDALKCGRLPEPSAYATAAKTGPAREVGSVTATKSTRTAFTPEDDQVLWEWVKRAEAAGGSAKGNEIYKGLEAVNSRHTFQSWRSRYIKIFAGNPSPNVSKSQSGTATPPNPANGHGSGKVPTRRNLAQSAIRDKKRKFDISTEASAGDDEHKPRKSRKDFTTADFRTLLASADDIHELDDLQAEEAWRAWAENNPTHSAAEWRIFYEEKVLPYYLAQRGASEFLKQPTNEGAYGDEDADKEGSERKDRYSQGDNDGTSLNDVLHNPIYDVLGDANSLENQLLAASVDQSPSTPVLAARSVNAQAEANPLIPDANEATGQQLQRELTQSPHTSRDLPAEDKLPTSRASQTSDNRPGASLSSGPALTEANLATQQALHRATATRGMDLPEDDQMHDQSDYIDYLKATLSTPRAKNELNLQHNSHINAVEGDNPKEEAPATDISVINTQTEHETQLMPPKPKQDVDYSQIFADDMPWPSSMERSSAQHDYTRTILENQSLSMQASADEGALTQNDIERDDEFELGFDLTEMPEPDGGFELDFTPRQHDRTSKSTLNGAYLTTQTGKRPVSLSNPNDTGRASSIISVSSAGRSSISVGSVQRSNTKRVLETQDIYNAETQYPQLTIPLPDLPEEVVDEEPIVKLPATDDRSDHGTTRNTEDMGAWVSRMQRKGYDHGHIIESLHCTSMRPDLAECVLLARKRGEGIPSQIPGVWTASDDADLEGGDARRLRAVQEKHGWDEFALRGEFLDAYRGLA